MTKRMLIDATHPEETRVAVVDGTRLEEFDFEIATRRQIKSNIYLAKVTRVEPSLQAAFVDYGGNRHGFLPFPEIHPDYYRIPVGDRQAFEEEEEYRPRQKGRRQSEPRAGEDSPAEGHPAEETEVEIDVSELPEALTADQPFAQSISSEVLPPGESGPQDHFPQAEQASDEHAAEPTPEPPETGPESLTALAAPVPMLSEVIEADASDALTGEGEPVESHEEPEPAERHHAPESEAAREQASSVEVLGGDEVEEQQRRRRAQLPRYKIQEVIKRRQIMLVQVSKEERGNKGAAVTTYLSLPGRYCVLMPNTSRGGGVSRKIANPADRKRMKDLISDLEVPEGMSVILRTAGLERSKAEIKRDLEYLLRLWENIRTLTLESTAPALIYEEGNLVKRAIRDLYSRDIDMIEIAGEEAYRQAKDFMRMLMPSHAKRVQPYRDPSIPLFFRYQVENQIDLIHNPVAHLKSGGYIVINQTEALVSIDVNSGRSTRERGIEETALKTNLEAADEIARQLRLRDLGGLIVIDFIDMDDPRHDSQVERRLKEAMKNDRARIQVGRISPFGLLELSRQRLHPSLIETNFHVCPHCMGTGLVRSIESAALLVLRAIEEEGIKHRAAELAVTVAGKIALYILNQKRGMLTEIELRYGFSVKVLADDGLIPPEHRIERVRMKPPGAELPTPVSQAAIVVGPIDVEEEEDDAEAEERAEIHGDGRSEEREGGERRRRRRRRRRGRGEEGHHEGAGAQVPAEGAAPQPESESAESDEDGATRSFEFGPAREGAEGAEGGRRRRRGRRGGRNRSRRGEEGRSDMPALPEAAEEVAFAEEHGLTETEAALAVVPSPASIPEPVAAEPRELVESVDLIAPTEPEPAEEPLPPPVEAPEPAEAPRAAETFNGAEGPESGEPPAPPPNRDYEVVNQPPAQPRRGWWKRLVE
ncbi:MAG TPA: ribonuclease E/G [Alphaproteobacteria bacterium]|nr:ribonuclease E/G [Alphaproteobacteria bacterium]